MMIKKEAMDKIKEYRKEHPNTWILLIGDGHSVIDFIEDKEKETFKSTTDKKIMGRMLMKPDTDKIPLNVNDKKEIPETSWRKPLSNSPVGNYYKPKQSDDESWEVKLDCVKECSKAPKEIVVSIKPIVKMKIDALMNKYKSQEWLGYYVGKQGEFTVYDLIIPSQRATSGSVNNIDYSVPEGMSIIGVVHSHHGMFTDFSGTDDQWINQNHNISTVVSHQGSKTQVRVKTMCESLIIVPGKLKVVYDVEFDEDSFVKESDEKINPPTTSYSFQGGHDYSGFSGYGPGFFREGGEIEDAPTSNKETAEKVEEKNAKDDKNVKDIEITKDYNPEECNYYYKIIQYTGESREGCRCTKIIGSYCTGYSVKCNQFKNKNGWDTGKSEANEHLDQHIESLQRKYGFDN